ncbi:helix-turn-helix domain-containing protein [Streptomyces griseolus]|uniref:helix-turn-helix domain-containing protein n=1 Tax=Streptomyces griseolus TaxID=1909 RepID=UPI002244BF10|nr:helix-turn-helix transcriptional regulator [Streptomyces griseolus]MCW8221170.1 helix-turn-helix transcriptional regulator [Streptomyces griseolus]
MTLPSSSAQSARAVVARRLRDLRKGAGLTVVELARGCGWHHAKTSRIENAKTAPTATDIRLWCRTVGSEGQADDLIVQSLHAESMYSEWRHRTRSGLKQLQDSAVTFFRQTELFRVYSSTLVPGLLQTEGYAAAVLGMSARFRDLPVDDSVEAARARVDRSRIVHERGHRFVLLVEEAVLRYRVGDDAAMAAQLGIVPAATKRQDQWPRETFHVYDDTLVSVELVSAQVRITQPSEIALYVRAFEDLRRSAVYGAAARALIVKAIEALG